MMAAKQSGTEPKALVAVIDELDTAKHVIETLHSQGVPLEKLELVTHDVHEEAPEINTPKVHETMATSLIDNAAKWSAVGAGLGALGGLAAIATTFPGLALGMVIMGGVTGGIVGGLAGVEHAAEDDSVDLPTLDEYEQYVKNGYALVVVLGSHDEVMAAEEIVKKTPHVSSHVHLVHGHAYHEHPARRKSE